MTGADVIDISNLTVQTLLIVSAPLMAIALLAGLIIALFQALTSIQEMTLTFVPKIVLLFASLILLLPWMASKLGAFTNELFGYIANGNL